MFELRERRQPLHSFIADIQPGQRGQTGAECFQLLHSLVILERFVRERSLDVADRAPHARRNVQLANMFQFADLLKLLGLDHRAVQIHHDDPEIPVRQLKRIADGTFDAVDHDLPAAPQDPKCDLPLVGERDLGQERQHARRTEPRDEHRADSTASARHSP